MNLAIKIVNISHKLRAIENAFFSGYKLMKYEFSTLAIISNGLSENDKVCASDVAKINDMSLSAVSRLLNNMESKNLISRIINTADRRNVIIRITDYGQQIYEEFEKSMNSFFNRIFNNLSEAERPLYIKMSAELLEASELELDRVLNCIQGAEPNND